MNIPTVCSQNRISIKQQQKKKGRIKTNNNERGRIKLNSEKEKKKKHKQLRSGHEDDTKSMVLSRLEYGISL